MKPKYRLKARKGNHVVYRGKPPARPKARPEKPEWPENFPRKLLVLESKGSQHLTNFYLNLRRLTELMKRAGSIRRIMRSPAEIRTHIKGFMDMNAASIGNVNADLSKHGMKKVTPRDIQDSFYVIARDVISGRRITARPAAKPLRLKAGR